MTKTRAEKYLAIYTLVITVPYFVLETYHYVLYRGAFSFLFVDYIAMSLFVLAGWLSLSSARGSAAGLLCGAWGFALCLNYRALFWRIEAIRAQETADIAEPIESVATVLIITFVSSAIAFLISLWLAWPERKVVDS